VFGRSRLALKRPVVWAEARRNCQQEGATLAVVNSQKEAENLRTLYFDYGPYKTDLELSAKNATETPLSNATVHIGLHDIFIEGQYLTVRSKYVCLLQGKVKKDDPRLDELSIIPLGHVGEWRYSSTFLNFGTSWM
jgi:hypothetical protein